MCVDGQPHIMVPGAPIVHSDGSQSPRLICIKCPYEQS